MKTIILTDETFNFDIFNCAEVNREIASKIHEEKVKEEHQKEKEKEIENFKILKEMIEKEVQKGNFLIQFLWTRWSKDIISISDFQKVAEKYLKPLGYKIIFDYYSSAWRNRSGKIAWGQIRWD